MARRKKIDEKKKKSSLPPIKCKGCDTMFVPKTRRDKYHSANCRETYYQEHYFSGDAVDKVCPNCGNEFRTTKPGRQDYCCEDCRKEAAKMRRDGITNEIMSQRRLFHTDKFRQMQLDHFACTFCGREVKDGVKLDVEEINDKLRTICNECSEGRKGQEQSGD